MTSSIRLPLGLAVALLAAAGAAADDSVVIMPDGFSIQGRVFKEKTPRDLDKSKFAGLIQFDVVDNGPAFTFFPTHQKRGAKVDTKVIPRDPTLKFNRVPPGQLFADLPSLGNLEVSEFDGEWRRTLTVKYKGGAKEEIKQMVTYLDPQVTYVSAWTHKWRQAYDTRELGPELVTRLLRTHPDLRDGWIPVVDPMKRMTIAQFLKECGWTESAKAELARAKKDAAWTWSKEANDRYDKIQTDIESAETARMVELLDAAVGAGQYDVASRFIARFKPNRIDEAAARRLATAKAKVETVKPRYDLTRRLLRDLIDGQSGTAVNSAHAAVGGAYAFGMVKKSELSPEIAYLLDGAEAVYAELHPDTLDRVDTFTDVAKTNDERLKAGKDANAKPEALLALAVTGWMKGKNGAVNDADAARRVWKTRQLAMRLLNEPSANDRLGLLNRFLETTPKVDPQELAQVISLLPPIDPEDVAAIRGKKIPAADAIGIPDIYKLETGQTPEDRVGFEYLVRLPPEYHHGRQYPVVIILHDPTLKPEKTLAGLASEAAQKGYILAAPYWSKGDSRFDLSGKHTPAFTATLRDLSRRFQIDQDRVFAFGLGEGGNFAFDLSMSRPDLLAGVVTFGAMPQPAFYREYYSNAQLLPVFCITGEMAGQAVQGLRTVYENWIPRGYNTLLRVYKGRGAEWYAGDVPVIFDWMTNKRRVRGNAALKLTENRFDPWKTFREKDDRFYWIGTSELNRGNTLKDPLNPLNPPVPATVRGDVRSGSEINIPSVYGIKKVVVWLERDMIDWEKPLRVKVADTTTDWKTEVQKPDLRLMFEELYRTGDRKLLYFKKLEFTIPGGR